ncbi:MAG: preQ(1) synthase [Candidatus Omnitrophica bacterium]|nr:preQ(1) synthase [Candidatus Omnitrophota bacterium]
MALKKKRSAYEGLQSQVRKMRTPAIEVWKNQYADKEYTIVVETPEFSCICPKTGLPDFASLRLEYIPDACCLELKSYKMYLLSFRNTGIFHEHVVNRICEDVARAARPRWVRVTGQFNPRGGITTTVTREYRR